jgi:cation transport regulator ChaC
MMWIFGYGSIIWRPSFSYEHACPAVLRGLRRRFWQGSTDHRGTPEAPGRVVTLVAEPDADCWGMAFSIAAANAQEVLAGLDHRESGGYVRHAIEIEFGDGTRTPALTYLAKPGNANFLGPAPLDEVAEQVRTSVGPSGANSDYVGRLAAALRDMEIYDEEVHALEVRLFD